MDKREIGKRPLEPITHAAAVEKIAQALERLHTSNKGRLMAVQEAIEKVMGFTVTIERF